MTDTEKMTDRVRKLLELARNNPNAHEAALAFARAQEIAAKHQIDLDVAAQADRTDDRPLEIEPVTHREIERMGRIPAWKTALLYEIAGANRCKTYTGYTRATREQPTQRTLNAYGQPSDLATVAYMYQAITLEIERLAKDAARGRGRSWGRNYRIGAAHEIGQRLRQATQRAIQAAREDAFASGGETALVRVDRALEHAGEIAAAVESYAKAELDLRKGSGYRYGSYGYGDGRAAGRTVRLGGGAALGSGAKALK